MNRALPGWLQILLSRFKVLVWAGALALTPLMRAASQQYEDDCDVFPSWNQYEEACRGLQPRWIARGSAVYMDRRTERPLTLFQNTANLGEQVNADEFKFDGSLGVEASLMRQTWDDNGIEVRFLGLEQFNASTTAMSAPNQWRVNGSPPVFLPNVHTVNANYDSELLSLETNYQYGFHDALSFSCGLRWLSLNEDLTATFEATPQTFRYDTLTRNDLYGAQVGVVAAPLYLLFGCREPTVFAKAGVFGNDARQRSVIDTGSATLSVHESASRVAWVGELGVATQYQLSRHLWILGGYSLLWIDRVTIASDQVVVNDFFNLTGINHRGSTLFYGANLGIGMQL